MPTVSFSGARTIALCFAPSGITPRLLRPAPHSCAGAVHDRNRGALDWGSAVQFALVVCCREDTGMVFLEQCRVANRTRNRKWAHSLWMSQCRRGHGSCKCASALAQHQWPMPLYLPFTPPFTRRRDHEHDSWADRTLLRVSLVLRLCRRYQNIHT